MKMEQMKGVKSAWEVVGDRLGGGGQSDVYTVRRPDRISERRTNFSLVWNFNPWTDAPAEQRELATNRCASGLADLARPDRPSDLGAMKIFKIRADAEQSRERLKLEIKMLKRDQAGLPKLLDSNADENWMVTEFFANGTLEDNSTKYKGDVVRAFTAFRSLLQTVAALHAEKIVHRDIKPANVFVRGDEELVLGDFGIVYVPESEARLTRPTETVGPHEYMPHWAEGGRLDDVDYTVDVYMLGKLLWCMVSGKLRLVRERFLRDDNNLVRLFPNDPAMHMVNVILKHCLVEEREDCKTSVSDLIQIVSTYLEILNRGGQLLHDGIERPCHVCGFGHYRNDRFPNTVPSVPPGGEVKFLMWVDGNRQTTLAVFPFVCDSCGHVELFTHAAPKSVMG